MMLLKACPHCGGDLTVDHDRTCGYLECVQCGHILSRSQEIALGVSITRHGVLRRRVPAACADECPAPPRTTLVTLPKR